MDNSSTQDIHILELPEDQELLFCFLEENVYKIFCIVPFNKNFPAKWNCGSAIKNDKGELEITLIPCTEPIVKKNIIGILKSESIKRNLSNLTILINEGCPFNISDLPTIEREEK
jgi:hypothetical protein